MSGYQIEEIKLVKSGKGQDIYKARFSNYGVSIPYLRNYLKTAYGVTPNKKPWKEGDSLAFKTYKGALSSKSYKGKSIKDMVDVEGKLVVEPIAKQIIEQPVETEVNIKETIPKEKNITIVPRNDSIGTAIINGTVEIPTEITPKEAYNIKVFNETTGNYSPLITRKELINATENNTNFTIDLPAGTNIKEIKKEQISADVAREFAERPDTEIAYQIAEKGMGIDTAIDALSYAIEGKIGSGEWDKMRKTEKEAMIMEGMEAISKGETEKWKWIYTKTGQGMVVPTLAIAGAGSLGKVAQKVATAAYVGMAGYQGIETIKNPNIRNAIGTVAMVAPVVAIKALPKIRAEISKVNRNMLESADFRARMEAKYGKTLREEWEQITTEEFLRKNTGREPTTAEKKWLADLKKEIGKIDNDMIVKSIIDKLINEELGKVAWKTIEPEERMALRIKSGLESMKQSELLSILEKRITNAANRAEMIDKANRMAIDYEGGRPISPREYMAKIKAKKYAEKLIAKEIKREFREARLREQQFEGEWGIDTGLKSYREAGKGYRKINKEILEEIAYERLMRKKGIGKLWKKKKITDKEKKRLRNESEKFLKENPDIEIAINKKGGILKEAEKRAKKRIKVWKPPKDTKGGMEIKQGKSKMMIKEKTKTKSKQRTEQMRKQISEQKKEYITKNQQRYAYMLAQRGMLKTIQIGSSKYAITPKSVLNQGKISGEKEKMLLVPITIASSKLTPQMISSIKELNLIDEIPERMNISKAKPETKEEKKTRILREKVLNKIKELEKKKKKQKKIEIHSIDDPLYRLTGKSKYSDIMNIMMKKKWGGIYA